MSLNIKNPEACKLAQELADLTGESLTTTVTEALRGRLRSERAARRKKALAKELLAIGKRCATGPKGRLKPVDHGEFLYDERGLPR